MTDELDRLRKELHAAEPRIVARAKGMNAAMAAFGKEFTVEDDSQSEPNIPSPLGRGMGEGAAAATAVSNNKTLTPTLSRREREQKEIKKSDPTQGSDTQRRLTGQNAPRGGAKARRRSMTSRLPTINMMFGGTAIAAGLAALVVLPNIKGDFQNIASRGDLAQVQTELHAVTSADKAEDVQAMAEVLPTAVDAESTLQVVPAEFKNAGQTVVVEEASEGLVVRPATFKAVPVAAAAAPQASLGAVAQAQSPQITTRVLDRPASVKRVAVSGKTANVQMRAPADGVRATPTEPPVYSVRRVAVPGKTATIQRRVADGKGGTKLVTEPIAVEEASEMLQIVPLPPGSEGRKVAPGNKLIVVPAQYQTVNETIVVAEDADGNAVDTRTVTRRVISVPASVKEVPADAVPQAFQTQNRDRFEAVEDYSTVASREEPVSTFSIDADTASYSFMRASLNRGQMPSPSSIRVEELINYFPYDYAAPTNAQEPFKANVTVTPTPWNADTKLMHIGIKGYTPPVAERPNSNIVLLIDTSGSMNQPNKLPLLINSFKLLLDTLGEDDTVSIVTYAGNAGTVLEPTPANERAKIVAAFGRLRAGGSTAGAAGLELAYNKAQESFDENGINRVILATDGDFNVGLGSPEEMKTFVERKRESGVFLSVLGFGMGNYNDHLMQTLAQNGNGVAAYIDTLSEARKVLADEAGGALIPIAKDVKIQVEFNPAQISEYRLIGYETRALNREDFNNDKVDAGEIGAGHTVTALYEVTPTGSPAETIDELRYAEAEVTPTTVTDTGDELAFVKIRYKRPNEDTSTLITRPIGPNDEAQSLDTVSAETQFAAAVSAFGQILRGSTRIGAYTYDDVIDLAVASKGNDEFGYRAEFINLVRLAKSLDTRR